MQFTDPETIQARARAVHALLPTGTNYRLTASDTRVVIRSSETVATRFDALRGIVAWDDVDGERREIALPEGTTAEAVAAITFALSEAREWS